MEENKDNQLDYKKIITSCSKVVGQYSLKGCKSEAEKYRIKIANEMAKFLIEKFGEAAYEYIEEAANTAIELDNSNSEDRMRVINTAIDCLITKATGTNVLDTQIAKRFMLRNSKDAIKENASENYRLIFSKDPHYQGLLRYNTFIEQPEYRENRNGKFKQLDDDFVKKLNAEVQQYYRIIPSITAISDGIMLASQNNSYDPVKQRIESTKWDGKKRAATFFIDYLGADNNDYVKATTETWLVGAVARVYQPGTKVDIVPILDGKQGIGKSTLVSLLAPPNYFTDGLSALSGDKDKDNLLQLHRNWIVELGELKAMSNTSIDGAKEFLSRVDDQYRAPYGRYVTTHLRKNVFIGTVNQPEYLHDLTGNRRFYPIHCEIDRATKKLPRPNDYNNSEILQALAEAKYLFDHGHPVMLSKDMEVVAHKKQASATAMDTQADLMLEYSELLVPNDWDEYSIYQRQQYWNRYKEYGEYSRRVIKGSGEDTKSDYILLEKDQLQKMPQFTNMELLEVVFNQDGKEIARGGNNKLTSKISMVFGNNPNWKKTNHAKLFGKDKKGYKRTFS